MYHASCMLFYVRLVCYPLKIIFQTDPGGRIAIAAKKF